MELFRKLTKAEAVDFRAAARRDFVPGMEINPLWHPIYQDECRIINGSDKCPCCDREITSEKVNEIWIK